MNNIEIKQTYLIFLLFIIGFFTGLKAQIIANDSLTIVDTNGLVVDTIEVDSNVIIGRKSKDALTTKVLYGARDKEIYSPAQNYVILIGNAWVEYGEMELRADSIYIDLETKQAYAMSRYDSIENKMIRPVFKEAAQEFQANSMVYNFENQKGIVTKAITKQSDLFVHGNKTKYVNGVDSLNTKTTIYNQDALFTTCNHEHPHFGIRSRKQKIIPNELVVIGSSNLEIEGIPTPLWLPFGIYPITNKKKAGLIMPNNYGRDGNGQLSRGIGFENLGFYLPISDRWDATFKMSAYTRNYFGFGVNTRYAKRHKYTGAIDINTDFQGVELERESGIKDSLLLGVGLSWNHSQESTAHPSLRLSGKGQVNIGDITQRQNLGYQDNIQQIYTSGLTLTKKVNFSDSYLTVKMSTTQNRTQNDFSISLPSVNYAWNNIRPFKLKDSPRDYFFEDFNLNYTFNAENKLVTKDTLLFQTWDPERLYKGANHRVSMSQPLKFFKYINGDARVDFNEYWMDRKVIRNNVGLLVDTNDFLIKDSIVVEDQLGFNRRATYSSSFNLSTRIFFTSKRISKRISGIRYTMSPSISLSWAPDYTDPEYDIRREYLLDASDENSLRSYNIFQGNLYAPNTSSGNFGINFSLGNLIEAKVFSKKKQEDHKFSPFNGGIPLSTRYSPDAEGQKWSLISGSSSMTLVPGILTSNFGYAWSLYSFQEDPDDEPQFYYNETQNIFKPLRFDMFFFQFNFSGITLKRLTAYWNQRLKTEKEKQEEAQRSPDDVKKAPQSTKDNTLYDYLTFRQVVEDISISYNHRLTWQDGGNGVDFESSTPNITINAPINISENWAFGLRTNYRFDQKAFGRTAFQVNRKLHCWNLSLNWDVESNRFGMNISANPGSLDFLKLPYNKSFYDDLR